MRDVDLLGELDALHREVRRGADAGRCVGKLFLPRELDQLLEVFRRHRRIHGDDVRRGRPEDHRNEIGERVVARVRIQARVHRVSDARDEQRIAVGRGALHLLRGDVAAGAGLVLHHHRLTKRLRQLRRHQARDQIGGARRRKADHDVNRFLLRPVLRQRWKSKQRGEQNSK